MRDDVAAVLQIPDIRRRLLDIGGEPGGQPPDEFGARVRTEIDKWKKSRGGGGDQAAVGPT